MKSTLSSHKKNKFRLAFYFQPWITYKKEYLKKDKYPAQKALRTLISQSLIDIKFKRKTKMELKNCCGTNDLWYLNYFFLEKILSWLSSLVQSTAVHGAMGCGQKSFKLVWWCHQLLSGLLADGHLPRVSRQSCLSAKDIHMDYLKREIHCIIHSILFSNSLEYFGKLNYI